MPAAIILNDGRLMLSPKIGQKRKLCSLTASIQHQMRCQKIEIKDMQLAMEEMKLSLLVENKIVYVENPKKPTEKAPTINK